MNDGGYGNDTVIAGTGNDYIDAREPGDVIRLI